MLRSIFTTSLEGAAQDSREPQDTPAVPEMWLLLSTTPQTSGQPKNPKPPSRLSLPQSGACDFGLSEQEVMLMGVTEW